MSFDKTAIEEANKHLEALSNRVLELDEIVRQQNNRLENIEAENQEKILAIVRQKDAEVEKLNDWLESTQAEIRRLNIELINKDVTISQLGSKASILEKATRYKGEVEGLLECFLEAENLAVAARRPASDMPAAATKPGIAQTVHAHETRGRSKTLEGNSSESSLSEEDFSDTEKIDLVWTPKAKTQMELESNQITSQHGKRNYASPHRIPGSAVKNGKGEAAVVMGDDVEEMYAKDYSTTQAASNSSSQRQASPIPLTNYETRL